MITAKRLLSTLMLICSMNALAADPAAEEARSFIDATPAASDVDVTVGAVAAPAAVITVLKPVNPMAKLRVEKRAALQANARAIPAAQILTRSERHQFALLHKADNNTLPWSKLFSDDENDDAGYDDLPLHQFYKRPRVVNEDPEAHANALLGTEKVRLRLFFARLKAMEAYALNQAPDDGAPLPSKVQSRLAEARALALARHAQLHS